MYATETLPYLVHYVVDGVEMQRLFTAYVYADAFLESLAKRHVNAFARQGNATVGNTFVDVNGKWSHYLD